MDVERFLSRILANEAFSDAELARVIQFVAEARYELARSRSWSRSLVRSMHLLSAYPAARYSVASSRGAVSSELAGALTEIEMAVEEAFWAGFIAHQPPTRPAARCILADERDVVTMLREEESGVAMLQEYAGWLNAITSSWTAQTAEMEPDSVLAVRYCSLYVYTCARVPQAAIAEARSTPVQRIVRMLGASRYLSASALAVVGERLALLDAGVDMNRVVDPGDGTLAQAATRLRTLGEVAILAEGVAG